MEQSVFKKLFLTFPQLKKFSIQEGLPVEYKNRHYCWVNLDDSCNIVLPVITLSIYELIIGDMLLAIRGSDIAFDFAVKGPLVERAKNHLGITVY
jgi:hypothetical protein